MKLKLLAGALSLAGAALSVPQISLAQATVKIDGSNGTLKWNLSGIAEDSTLVVLVRGGTCADRLGLVVKSTWESHFRDGTSVETRTMEPDWVTFFKRNWTSRGGDVAIVKNDGQSQCVPLVKQ